MKMSHARNEYEDFRMQAPDVFEVVLALGRFAARAGLDERLLELIKLKVEIILSFRCLPAGRDG
jgi:hypothetical protein